MITTAEIMSLTDYERGKIDGMIELVSSLSENLNGKVTKLAENHIRHIQLRTPCQSNRQIPCTLCALCVPPCFLQSGTGA